MLGVAHVPRLASGVFDEVQKRMAVRAELDELEKASGCVHYGADQESNMSVIDGFLTVHYFGKLSIVVGARKAEGITGLVVADFFNTVGRTASEGHTIY